MTRLLSVFVSFNRLELLRRTLSSYADTVTVPHDVVIVDSASDCETRDWLAESGYTVLMLPANRHLGYAANRGFRLRDERHDLLHRSDNDVLYLAGWCERTLERFDTDDGVGMVGLRTAEADEFAGNPGGNIVLRAAVWDAGVRYADEPWDIHPWPTRLLTERVEEAGWRWTRVLEPGIVHCGSSDPADPYFREAMRQRGIDVTEPA